MVRVSGKIVSSIIGIIAVGAITATAATAPHVSRTSEASSAVSGAVSSEAVSSKAPSAVSSTAVSLAAPSSSASKTEVKKVADGVDEIQKATDDGVSQIHEETQKAISQIKGTTSSAASKVVSYAAIKYNIVSPIDGSLVFTDDSNYEKYKAELGGDAGTVPPKQSAACKAALEKIEAAYEASKAQESEDSQVEGKRAN